MSDIELMRLAEAERKKAYCPYSGFSVGAALLCSDGSVFCGANIENASFSPTVCAERVAFFSAVNAGKKDFVKIAVTGGKRGEQAESVCAPCGVCRQVMNEFCTEDFRIVLGNEEELKSYTLGEILPLGFKL